jgi:sugar/nucleoside kinase (ribokinase family)
MPPAFDVLSYGTIGIDTILHVPYLPTPGRGAHAREEIEHLGGKASNVAVHLASWGLTVAISGTAIGDDWVGERLDSILAQYPRISTRYLRRVPGLRSMYCRILVTPDGDRTIIGVHVDENPQTPPTPEMVADARLLTLDLYGGPERVDVARLAAAAGRPVVVGDVRSIDHPVLPYTTVAIASAAEVRTDYPGLALADFAQRIQAVGAQNVIITDGPDDVLAFDAQGDASAITPPRMTVLDATGAGDAFRAGVVYGVLAGWPLVECAAFGAAAGAINVGRPGAASHPAAVAEVSELATSLVRRLLLGGVPG